MLIGFGLPCLFMLARSQLGAEPSSCPTAKLAAAALIAAAFAAGYQALVPDNGFIQLLSGIAIFALYLALLPGLRIVPRHHWAALVQIVRSQFGRSGGTFDPEKAIGGLDDADRVALRIAIVKGKPVDQIPERLANRGLPQNGAGRRSDRRRRPSPRGRERWNTDPEGKKAARRWGSPARARRQHRRIPLPGGHGRPARRKDADAAGGGRAKRRPHGARGGDGRARERARKGLEGPG